MPPLKNRWFENESEGILELVSIAVKHALIYQIYFNKELYTSLTI